MKALKVKVILVILALGMFTGCSTVKVEMNGQPAPDYIREVTVLGLELQLDMAYAYFYQRPEEDEMLDTVQYIESSGITFNIRKKNLTSVKCMFNVFNPYKNQYSVRLHHVLYGVDGDHLASSSRTLYNGKLSAKTFSEDLSIIGDVTHEVWLEVYDEEGNIRYAEPLPLRYNIVE